MKKKLGEKFGVVFSFAVVVTDTELFGCVGVVLASLQKERYNCEHHPPSYSPQALENDY